MRVTALIPAAGSGERLGGKINKQFIEINSKPILVYTLEKFEKCRSIDEVILILPQRWLEYGRSQIVARFGLRKVERIIPGGKERQDSVYHGLKAIKEKTDVVLIHDGVRPFIRPDKIEESVRLCQQFGATILALPVRYTLKEVHDGTVVRTLDRKLLWEIQTPQTFRYDIILEAYSKAMKEGFYSTDDSALVERVGYKVKILEGQWDNIKITSPWDLELAKLLIRNANRIRL